MSHLRPWSAASAVIALLAACGGGDARTATGSKAPDIDVADGDARAPAPFVERRSRERSRSARRDRRRRRRRGRVPDRRRRDRRRRRHRAVRDDARHERVSGRAARRSRARERRRRQRLVVVERDRALRRRGHAAGRLHPQRELGHRRDERDRVRAGTRRASLRRRAGRDAARRQERRAADDAVRLDRGRFERRARPDRRRAVAELRDQRLRLRLRDARPRAARTTASAASPPNGDVAAAGSETTLVDLPHLSGATNHNGGGMHFGPDGKLYVGVGENANPQLAQDLSIAARQAPALQRGRHDPERQPVLRDAVGPGARDLGLRAAQSLHLRVPAGQRPPLHQRRRPEHVGRDRRRQRGRELRLAELGRARQRDRRHHRAALHLQAQRGEPAGIRAGRVLHRLRDRRRRVLSRERTVPGRLSRPVLLRRLRRWLRRPLRHRQRRRLRVRHAVGVAGRPPGRQRRRGATC